ncbi:transposase [Notoacmeibacter marinus]|uniref:transposase n=1 Tax=Notoacmeibacter marinus TaxID=1876515 RepID=UPI000B8C676E
MTTPRFAERQIAMIWKQVDGCLGVSKVGRNAGDWHRPTIRWRKRYGGLMPSEVKRLKQLEEENRRLKEMVADLSLDKAMLQNVLAKNCEACTGTRDLRLSARRVRSIDPTGLLPPLNSGSTKSPRRVCDTIIGASMCFCSQKDGG